MTLLRTASETEGAAFRSVPAGANDAETPLVKLTPPSQRRPSFVLGGALAVLFAAALGGWVLTTSSSTISIMVMARDVEAGEVVAATDLRAVEVGHFSDARAVQPHQQALVVGLAARGPLAEGTVINTDLLIARSQVIPAGMAVVGAELEPGAAPAGAFEPGDRVALLGTQRATSASAEASEEAELLTEGSLWAIERPDGSYGGRMVVALLVPEEAQGRVAQAAADGRLRIALVGEQQ